MAIEIATKEEIRKMLEEHRMSMAKILRDELNRFSKQAASGNGLNLIRLDKWCEQTGMDKPTAYQKLRAGQLPGEKIGKRWYVRVGEI